MTSTRNPRGRHVANRTGHVLALLLTVSFAAGMGQRAQAQEPSVPRMWAAQTGWNQVTLSWEEIPGAVEYRIYAGDPDSVTVPAARRPISTLSGSGRYAIITGINRISGGLYLEAVGADRRRRRKLKFNSVTAVRTAQVIAAPAEATATVTSDTVITLSWTAVPGATAYVIGRAVSPDGFRMLCGLCSTEPTYIDREAQPGAAHSYTVAAVFPGGLSTRTESNLVTPGAPVVVAEGTGTPGTPLPTLPSSNPTTSYTPPGQPAGTMPSYTPPGTSTPPAQTPTTTTPTPTSGSTTVSTTFLTSLQQQVDSLRTWLTPYLSGLQIQTATSADSAKMALVLHQLDSLRTTATDTAGNLLQTVGTTAASVVQQAVAGFVQQVDAFRSSVQNIFGSVVTRLSTTTTTHAATPAWSGPCRVDYQRADNMWAPFGKPVGTLGTESLSLPDGQAKLFFTDWTYEKLRNDGSNYYGSHLRIATNAGARPVKLQAHTALSSGWLTLNPGETRQFQSDLDQISCTNQ